VILLPPAQLPHVRLRRVEPVGLGVGPEARQERPHVGEHAAGGAEACDGRDAREARTGAELEHGGAGERVGLGRGEVGGQDDGRVPEPGACKRAAGGRVVRVVALHHGQGPAGHIYLQRRMHHVWLIC
jgi:hypothetical protein